METVLYKGRIIPAANIPFDADNRAFKFGDGLFETMQFREGKVRFWEDHLERISKGLNALGIEVPAYFSGMQDIICQFMDTLGKDQGGLRWQAWRSGGGRYSPETNTCSDLLVYNGKNTTRAGALKLGVSQQGRVHYSPFSRFKTCNSLPYILAAIERSGSSYDDLILTNHNGEISECISSNIFWVKDRTFMTPPVKAPCGFMSAVS